MDINGSKVDIENLVLTDNEISETVDSQKNDDAYNNEILYAVARINEKFSIQYGDLWLKNSNEDEFLIAWVDKFIEEDISPDVIDKIMKKSISCSEFSKYPPKLGEFMEMCRQHDKKSYNFPTKEEAYMIASGKRDVHFCDAHVVVRETVKRVEEFRIKYDPSVKSEFYSTYKKVAQEYTDNDGNVPFNDKISRENDFKNEQNRYDDPPLGKDEAMGYLENILSDFKLKP